MYKFLQTTAVIGYSGALLLSSLVIYNKYRIEPHITLRQKGDRTEVHMTGLTKSHVVTESMEHHGLKCLDEQGYQVVERSCFKILPSCKRGDPVFVFAPLNDVGDYDDVQLERFRGACRKCNVRTDFAYTDLMCYRQHKSIDWS